MRRFRLNRIRGRVQLEGAVGTSAEGGGIVKLFDFVKSRLQDTPHLYHPYCIAGNAASLCKEQTDKDNFMECAQQEKGNLTRACI